MDKNVEMAKKLAEAVNNAGGRAYYVGGYVRDRLMNNPTKDIDVEIHGITCGQLERILDCLGSRLQIGESFGIYTLKGYDIDIALPRKEIRIGNGHRSFDVTVDPYLGTEKASARRDFTINSIMMDIISEEITDHYNGMEDLKNGILRHTNPHTFSEDSLRVLRAAQFAARFNFKVADETITLCRSIDITDLSRERVMGELTKAILKSNTPSVFFEFLKDVNKLDYWFPELKALIGIKQNPEFHPEGDVWTHTMIVLDCCADFRSKAEYPLGFMMLGLCHDMGKALCTESINGVIHSYGHEKLGLTAVNAFIRRLTDEKKLCRYVVNMTENHMKPFQCAGALSSVKATNKMFDRAFSSDDLVLFSLCDNCLKENTKEYRNNYRFLLDRLDLYKETMSRPFVTGKDLISAGLKPDKNFSEILQYAHKLRLAGVNKESALKQTVSFAAKLH